jgi:predicted transcriptional regulator
VAEKIKERLGLDFLKPLEKSDRAFPQEDPAFNSALLAYGWRFLDFLGKANGIVRLYQVIDVVQMPIEVALKIVDYFESRGLIQVIQRDLKGDHTITITPLGKNVLSQYQPT